MEIEMNDRIYNIKFVSQDELFGVIKEQNDCKTTYFGRFLPYEQEIWIDKNLSKEQKIKTLIHELTHCYIWSYMTSLEQLNEEDICNITSNSHIIIENIIKNYMNLL